MTQSKREPFAKATKHPTLDTWLVADAAGNNLCWADDSQAWEQWDAESRANSINAAFNARVDEEVRKAVAERDARIAELERVLKDTCELMDKCAGRLNVFVAQHAGSRDEYFVFELNRLSVCAGALDAMSRKAIAEIKSVLGKGE